MLVLTPINLDEANAFVSLHHWEKRGLTPIFALATVHKALHELEDWTEGPRIARIRGGRAHRF